MKKIALGLMSVLAVLIISFNNDVSTNDVQRYSILAGHGDYGG
jgi:hypothetical protein